MKQVIGIDIDGVLNDADWEKMLSDFVGRRLERVNDDYDLGSSFNLPSDTLMHFFEEKFFKIMADIPMAELASAVVRVLSGKYTIYIVTARDIKYNHITTNWLQKHLIPYYRLINTPDKATVAKTRDFKWFIEDCAENAQEIINLGIPVILFDNWYNRKIEPQAGLYRVKHWEEVLNILMPKRRELIDE